MSDLERVRKRYDETPREFDDDLTRMSRGDRGCLGDGLAGGGALGAILTGFAAAYGLLPPILPFVCILFLVAGFFVGTAAQITDTRRRQKALTAGPLVACHVLRAEDYLSEKGRRRGRAIVVFSPDPEVRFDGRFLRKTVRRLERSLEQPGAVVAKDSAAGLARGIDEYGFHRLPESISEGHEAWIADVLVDPDRLEGGKLGERQPGLTAIVVTDQAFIEHV